MTKTSSSGSRFSLLVAAGIALATPPGIAFAQQLSAADVAQARHLFNEGIRLRDQGDPRGAIEKLTAARAIARTPIIDLELGRTRAAEGKLVDARETLLSVAAIPLQPQETARSAAARAESADLAEQLRLRIPRLMVKVVGVPLDSVVVTIDDAIVPNEQLAEPRLVDPGTHGISARSSLGGAAATTVDLQEGESRDVELTIALPSDAPRLVESPPAAAPAPAPSVQRVPPVQAGVRKASSTRTLGVVLGGIGAAGIALGTYFGLRAISDKNVIDANCTGSVCRKEAGMNAQRDAHTMAALSDLSFALGAAGLGVGAYVVLISRDRPASAVVRITTVLRARLAGFDAEVVW